MRKYIKLKVFKGELGKYAVFLAFAIRGNQFCLTPCIRWKGGTDVDEEPCRVHAIQFMWLWFVVGFGRIRIYT